MGEYTINSIIVISSNKYQKSSTLISRVIGVAYIGKVVDLTKEGKRHRNGYSSNLVNTGWECTVSIHLSKWIAKEFFKLYSRYFRKS